MSTTAFGGTPPGTVTNAGGLPGGSGRPGFPDAIEPVGDGRVRVRNGHGGWPGVQTGHPRWEGPTFVWRYH